MTATVQEQGNFVAIHEMEHIRTHLGKTIANVSEMEAEPRAKLYAMRHLIALDNHIRQSIAQLKEPARAVD
jgi:hypothetical protein